MAHTIYNLFHRKTTPQNAPVPGSNQVPNSAGGYAWQLDPWQRLMRFLVLGTEGGTYYISEQSLTRDNAANALRCLAEDGERFVRTVVDVSENGRAYKNDPAIFALALASCSERRRDAPDGAGGAAAGGPQRDAPAALCRVCRWAARVGARAAQGGGELVRWQE